MEYKNFFEERLKEQIEAASTRYNSRQKDRSTWAEKLKSQSIVDIESKERVIARRSMIEPNDGPSLERIIGKSDLFPITYLQAGLEAGKSVCRMELCDRIGRVIGYGTGFLVSSSLLLTNNHVLPDEEAARFCFAQFNYQLDLQLNPLPVKSFRLAPERFFITDKKLDFSLVAVETLSPEGVSLSEFGMLKLIAQPGKILVGEYVSIIQHPQGGKKMVTLRENEVVDCFDDFIHYAADTDCGSSGSAALNDSWQVVALHHSAVPDPNDSTKYVANEGIRISSIMKFLQEKRNELSVNEKNLLTEVLGDTTAGTNSTTVSTINVGELPTTIYNEMQGYNPMFLGNGYEINLPHLNPDLMADVSTLPNGKKQLDYTHFSIVMSKSRRLALYTAVNIDGKSWKSLGRNNDEWYFDSRLDKNLQIGPELYRANDIDRGHLVRRLDPCWGDTSIVQKANNDTFHFTNCSPQHKNFNQKTWLDLEDYILKNADLYDMKVTVFTGPVFREDDILYRGEFQIPAEFWKVVVIVKTDNKLSATAYLQTQKNLIDNLEFAYGSYKTYQVPIEKIEGITGLNFGNLRSYDPMANIETTVGRVIYGKQDIRL